MLKHKKWGITILSLTVLTFILSSCSTKKSVKYTKRTIPSRSSVAVIIDSPNNIKNVVLAKFLAKGFNVKAINAADFYRLGDIFDISDLKKISFSGDASNSLLSMEKTYNNIFKLHMYNFEISKAELLSEIKTKWKVNYLILLDLRDWGEVSWARVISLENNEIIWLENYPTGYGDNIETIVDHFIKSMTRR
ncbi:hypothetical protein ACFL20_00130 [Spirochaetota bacterium]